MSANMYSAVVSNLGSLVRAGFRIDQAIYRTARTFGLDCATVQDVVNGFIAFKVAA